jgi:hypothetical protein
MSSSIAAIHVAKKSLGLDEDTYRAKLELITGKQSTKDMTEAERQKVLTVFRNEGFAPAAPSRRADGRMKLAGPYAKKLQALWIAGWNLGIFENRDDAALEAFVRRQTGIEKERWLRYAEDANKVIEGLKAILARDGGVTWKEPKLAPEFQRTSGYKIARAQFHIMLPEAPVHDFWILVNDITRKADANRDFHDHEWIVVMNDFGEKIRAAKKAGA